MREQCSDCVDGRCTMNCPQGPPATKLDLVGGAGAKIGLETLPPQSRISFKPQPAQRFENPKALSPSTFHFWIPEAPCPAWHLDGNHRVTDGKCRCGKKFVLMEVR